MSRAGTASEVRSWRCLLDALDLGVILSDPALAQVRCANRAGTHALMLMGGERGLLPEAVRAAVRARVPGKLPAGRFTPAVEVTTPFGPSYFVCVKHVGAPLEGAVVTVTRACLRFSDRVALLGRRLGLSRRQSECAALVRDGLRNREIAARLRLRPGTVSQYLVTLYERLGVRGRGALVARVDEVTRPEPAPGARDASAAATTRGRPERKG